MRLILIRHGDPDYEHDTLTQKGRREAALLAERTKTWKVDDVYTSPLGRARATAQPSLQNWGKEAVILDWAQEFFYLVPDGKGRAHRVGLFPLRMDEVRREFHRKQVDRARGDGAPPRRL